MELLMRYLAADNTGLAGKVAQFYHGQTSTQPPAGAPCTVPREVADALDELTEQPAYAGTVAHVFRGVHRGAQVCLKVVPPATRRLLAADREQLDRGGAVGQLFSDEAGGFVSVLGASLLREACMAQEREMAAATRAALATAAYEDLRVAVAPEVPALCTGRCFAYRYIDAAPLPRPAPDGVARRIVALFFRLALLHGVLLSDPNPGNFLYDAAGDRLWVLDFGNTHRLTEAQRGTFVLLHQGRGEERALRRAIPGLSDETYAMLLALMRSFWVDDAPFQGPAAVMALLAAAGGTLRGAVPEDMAVALRALITLGCSLCGGMGVTQLATREALSSIVPAAGAPGPEGINVQPDSKADAAGEESKR